MLLGLHCFLRLDAESLLTFLDALLIHLLGHDAKALGPLLLLPFLLFEKFKSLCSRGRILYARNHGSFTKAKACLTKLASLLWTQVLYFLISISRLRCSLVFASSHVLVRTVEVNKLTCIRLGRLSRGCLRILLLLHHYGFNLDYWLDRSNNCSDVLD